MLDWLKVVRLLLAIWRQSVYIYASRIRWFILFVYILHFYAVYSIATARILFIFLSLDDAIAAQAENILEKALRQTLRFGVGYLHEGLTPEVRQTVERLYETGAIQVLVVSEPLTWNLTQVAHCVVVQETTKYDPRQKRYRQRHCSQE